MKKERRVKNILHEKAEQCGNTKTVLSRKEAGKKQESRNLKGMKVRKFKSMLRGGFYD